MNKLLEVLLSDVSYFSFLSIMMIMFGVFAYAQFKNDDFDLRSTVYDGKTVSLGKFGQLLALMVSSWGFVYLIAHDRMSEWYFFSYVAVWVGTTPLEKFLDRRNSTKEPEKE